jgi:hypothetical protein
VSWTSWAEFRRGALAAAGPVDPIREGFAVVDAELEARRVARQVAPFLELSFDAIAVLSTVDEFGGRLLLLDLIDEVPPGADVAAGVRDLAARGLLDQSFAVGEDGEVAEPIVALRYNAMLPGAEG